MSETGWVMAFFVAFLATALLVVMSLELMRIIP